MNSCINMRMPVMSNTMAKTFFNLALFSLEAINTPIGANKTVRGVMQRNPIRLTSPNVPVGASVGVFPNRSMVSAPGREMMRPIAEAVPTALWVG